MKKIVIFITILLLVSSYFIYKKLNPIELPPYLVEAVGRIDGDLISLNTKYPARIEKIDVNTGDFVKKGEIIAKLDSKEFNDKLKSVDYEIKAKQNEYDYTKVKVENNIKKAKTNYEIKQKEFQNINYEIKSLELIVKQDKKDEKRTQQLVNQKLEKPHSLELLKLKTKTDINKLNSLKIKKEILSKTLNIAKHDLNIAISSKDSLNALENSILALKSKKQELQTIIDELTLKSPVNGYIDTKVSNVGEVIGAGMSVVTIINPKSFYLKIYVDEINNGKIKIGDKAEIFLDSYPNKPILAKVSKIAKKAEFTPKDVAVRSDRITRVYEVHLKPLKNNKLLKLGLPGVGVILIDKGKLPTNLNQIPKL